VLAGAGHEGKVAGDWERRWPLPVDPKKASRPQKHPTTTIPQQIFFFFPFLLEGKLSTTGQQPQSGIAALDTAKHCDTVNCGITEPFRLDKNEQNDMAPYCHVNH